MSTAVIATTTASPFAPKPEAFAAHVARFKSQETCPAILPLLDRNALRLLAVWSPDLISTPNPSHDSHSSHSSHSSHPTTPFLFSDLWSSVRIDFARLADLTGLGDAPLKTAFRQVKAHRLIYPDGSLNTHVKDLLDARTHRLTAFAQRRRLLANRANALKSTGPRSAEGKAVSALNALKHALSAETPVLLGEKREHFDAYRQAFHTEYDPQGTTETLLVDQLAHIAWRLRRVDMAEAYLCMRLHNIDQERIRREVLRPYQPRGPLMAPDADAGFILVRACEEKLLPKIDRHYTTLHRAFFRTLHELLDIQSARHNASDENAIQQVGFVLQNENPFPAPTPSIAVSGVAQPPPVASVAVSVPAPHTPHPAPRPFSVPEPHTPNPEPRTFDLPGLPSPVPGLPSFVPASPTPLPGLPSPVSGHPSSVPAPRTPNPDRSSSPLPPFHHHCKISPLPNCPLPPRWNR